jgi:hypothetical protein
MPLLRVETRSAVPWTGFRILSPKGCFQGWPAAIRSAVIPVKMETPYRVLHGQNRAGFRASPLGRDPE